MPDTMLSILSWCCPASMVPHSDSLFLLESTFSLTFGMPLFLSSLPVLEAGSQMDNWEGHRWEKLQKAGGLAPGELRGIRR